MLATLTRADFLDHIGGTFTLHHAEATIRLELVEVADLSRYKNESISPRAPFTLVLQGPAEPHIPQDSYDIELPDGRRMEGVMMTPMHVPHRPGVSTPPHYQICFS